MPQEYEVELFKERDFVRKKCQGCGRFYWSLGDRKNCGEPPCAEYTFIGNPPTDKKYSLDEMRESYLSFFEEHDHTRIGRYPVVARWRDDIFFSIASISCFQPWVLNGTVEPPANPLVMSQTSLRFNDIDNVGKTGRHLTEFEMMGHHAFNTQDNEVYFKDHTVKLCHLLLQDLGIPEEKITYIEEEWSGGGNSGPCFEVIVDGVELATLVFMMYEQTPEGKKEMDMQVVDTGYGLERFAWLSQGTSNAYEAIFPEVLSKLKEEASLTADEEILSEYSKMAGMMNVESQADHRILRERVAESIGVSKGKLVKEIRPFEHLYAICDHSRSLAFMFNDGVVPSNVKEGYFARLLVRRSIRSLKSLDLHPGLSLKDVVDWQIDSLGDYYKDLRENREDILKLTAVEEERYEETVSKGKKIIAGYEQRARKEGRSTLDREELIQLYDTYGLVPEVVQENTEMDIDVPEDFYIQVAEEHSMPEEEKEQERECPDLSDICFTKLRFYEDEKKTDFTAKVMDVKDNKVFLDQTYFYPKGGGQEGDTGFIGDKKVKRVWKEGKVVVHELENTRGIEKGQEIQGKIDWERRKQLMKHHTATHVVNGAAKKVLGNHIWQAGAHKSIDISRLDITHYESPTPEQLEEIQRLSNRIIEENRPVEKYFMDRNEAERTHGFRIYQGGAVPGKELRIVDIKDWDVEACGGTHFDCTGELGGIKIIRAKRIQDGVVRLEFKSGKALSQYVDKTRKISRKICQELSVEKDIQEMDESTMKEIAGIYSVPLDKLPSTMKKFKNQWCEQVEEIKQLEKKIGKQIYSQKYEQDPWQKENPVEAGKELFTQWKNQSKELDELRDRLKSNLKEKLQEKLESDYKKVDGVKVIKHVTEGLDVKQLRELATSLVEESTLIILGNIDDKKAQVVIASDSKFNAADLINEIGSKIKGGGSGNKNIAVGGGKASELEEVIEGYLPEEGT